MSISCFQFDVSARNDFGVSAGSDWDVDDFEDEGADPIFPLLVTTAEAAEMLAICPATLRELTRRDLIRQVEFIATGFNRPIRRYRVADLQEFIERFLR
jgi:hypothetical protein